MNLKEAFRFQNKLQSLFDCVEAELQDRRNMMTVETTILRGKVMADAENEVIQENADAVYAGRGNDLMNFLLFLLEQKEKLSAAIAEAKKTLPIDMDSATALNAQRQSAARVLRDLVNLRSSERTVSGGGVGYRFNAEGNQITYKCDAKTVNTINFDRNAARKYLTELNRKADDVSAEIDRCVVNTKVDYEAPFDVNDSFEEILEQLYPTA